MFARIALLSLLRASIAEKVCDAAQPDCATDQEETGLLQARAQAQVHQLPPCYASGDWSTNVCGNPTWGCFPSKACLGGGAPTQCNAGGVGQVCRFCYKDASQVGSLPGGIMCPPVIVGTVETPVTVPALLEKAEVEVLPPCYASGDWSTNVCGNPTWGCFPSAACLGGAAPTQCNAGGVGQVCRFCYKDASQVGSLPGGIMCPPVFVGTVSTPVTVPALLEKAEVEVLPPCYASGDWSTNVCGNPTWGCFPSAACLGGAAPTQCNAGGVGQVCRFCYKDASQVGSLPGGIMCPPVFVGTVSTPVTLPAF